MNIRTATLEDLPQIIQMIVNDALGKTREEFGNPLPDHYLKAFNLIHDDPNQYLLVCEDDQNKIIATLQLTYIQYLTYKGGVRAQIEAVRVHEDARGKGIGEYIMKYAIDHARSKGAHLVQLTTDKRRTRAKTFYERLGFNASHEGMKLHF